MNVYAIRAEDEKKFNEPFLAQDDFQATRMFCMVAGNDAMQISVFPERFSLYLVCEISDEMAVKTGKEKDGKILKGPHFICGAIEHSETIEKIRKEKVRIQEMQRHYAGLYKKEIGELLSNKKKKKSWFGRR